MGPIARAVAYGCAQALKWIFWLTSSLLVVLVVVQYVRGDVTARPLANLLVMAGFAAAGFVSHFIGKKIADN